MCIGAILVTSGVAESAPHATKTAAVTKVKNVAARNNLVFPGARPAAVFNDELQLATFLIPISGCPAGHPNCQWMLFMNEPRVDGQPIVGEAVGTSGQLTLSYPDYCGPVQIDVLVGPAPWIYVSGRNHKVFGCIDPTTTTTTSTSTTSTTSTTTTTTTTTTSTTTTTGPANTSTTTTTLAPAVAGSNTTPTNGSSALPFTAASSTSATKSTMANGSSSLPFTGTNVSELALLGTLLILVGGALLFTVESRRRALARTAVIRLDQLKTGARETGYWFFGS